MRRQAKAPTPKEIRYRDNTDGVQNGIHVMTVTSRHPRHVHYAHVWPDGVRCSGSMWISAWRSYPKNLELTGHTEISTVVFEDSLVVC